jgi:hypothetical protein
VHKEVFDLCFFETKKVRDFGVEDWLFVIAAEARFVPPGQPS